MTHSPRYCLSQFIRLCLVAAAASVLGAGAKAEPERDWFEQPPGTLLGQVTERAGASAGLRADMQAVDPSRGASGRLLVFRYAPRSERETAALLIPIILAEPLWKLDQHTIAKAGEESGEHPRLGTVSKTLTRLGNAPATLALCAALYSGGHSHGRKAAQDVASAGITSSLAVDLLKRTFRRERPDDALMGTDSQSFSFPSGHAATAFSTATVMAHYYPDLKEPGYVGAALISLSRVTLRRHYPTDIIAGAVVGTLVAKQVLKHNGNLFEWRW